MITYVSSQLKEKSQLVHHDVYYTIFISLTLQFDSVGLLHHSPLPAALVVCDTETFKVLDEAYMKDVTKYFKPKLTKCRFKNR